MIVAVDETGDANLGIHTPRFAVGALYLADTSHAESVIEDARLKLGATGHNFHYSHDSLAAQNAVSDALDSTALNFGLKIVVYEGEIPAEHLTMAQNELHARALGHSLNFVPFLPATDVLLSAREGSLVQKDFPDVVRSIDRASGHAATAHAEMRRHPDSTAVRVQILKGIGAAAVQLCDHLLGRWQAHTYKGKELRLPKGTTMISGSSEHLPYFKIIHIIRGEGSPMHLAEAYSVERATIGSQSPLFAVNELLYTAGEANWTEQDHRIILLLLNLPEEQLYASDELIAELCYLVLEGRTRWPLRFEMAKGDFQLYGVLGSAFLNGTHSQQELAAFDALRMQIRAFRKALKQT